MPIRATVTASCLVAFVGFALAARPLPPDGSTGELRYEASIRLDLLAAGPQQVDFAEGLLELPKFPAELGVLSDVRFEVRVNSRNSLGLENLERDAAEIERLAMQVTQLSLLDGTPLAVAQLQSQSLIQLRAFDGEVDFSGSSGLQVPLAADFEEAASFAPGEYFVTTNGSEHLELSVGAHSALDLQCSTLPAGSLRSRVSVTVEVIYSY